MSVMFYIVVAIIVVDVASVGVVDFRWLPHELQALAYDRQCHPCSTDID